MKMTSVFWSSFESLQGRDFGGKMRWAGRPGMEEKNEYTIIMD